MKESLAEQIANRAGTVFWLPEVHFYLEGWGVEIHFSSLIRKKPLKCMPGSSDVARHTAKHESVLFIIR
jgi:hypothetical protein